MVKKSRGFGLVANNGDLWHNKSMVDQRFPVAVHIMTSLSFGKCQEGSLMTSEQLANSINTNAAVVRKILAKLVDAHLLKSYKGKSGGVELAKCPSEITLKNIYEAVVEKTLLTPPKKSPKKSCPVSCCMKNLMSEVINGVEQNSMSYLSGIKLSDLTAKVK